jgi:dihydroxy-acid dehydratase
VIAIDLDARTLTLEADDVQERLEAWRPPQLPYATGVFGRYRALVSSASEGAVLRNG